MAKHRTHSAAFKRQVAEEFIAGEALHALSKRHDISRQLIRIWVGKFEAGALDDDVQAADLLQEYEAKIAALERMVGRQALEIEMQSLLLACQDSKRIVETQAICQEWTPMQLMENVCLSLISAVSYSFVTATRDHVRSGSNVVVSLAVRSVSGPRFF
jgi:transposase